MHRLEFDPSAARERVAKLWSLEALYGVEREASHIYLDEIVSDRYALVNGLQLLRDELQLAGSVPHAGDLEACTADARLPSVITTLGHTNCGDRAHQGESLAGYLRAVANRFATLSELGELKVESFLPTGGGADDAGTLAHVTVGHQLDPRMRDWLYQGNAQSFRLVNLDLKTHCGRLDHADGRLELGMIKEAPWRAARASCGAVMGLLRHFDSGNGVHRRLREDLGEDNFEFLRTTGLRTDTGIDATLLVAAAIIALRGAHKTLWALTDELDERGVAHVTASVLINRVSRADTLIYLGRGTLFEGEVRMQGLGFDARKYSCRLAESDGEQRLRLGYDGREEVGLPVLREYYGLERQSRAYRPDEEAL